jgi:hypothetical protein
MSSFGYGNNSGVGESPKAGPSPAPSPGSGSNNVRESIRVISSIAHAQEEIPFIVTNENGSPLTASKSPLKGVISLLSNENTILVTPTSLAENEQIIVSIGSQDMSVQPGEIVKISAHTPRQLGITVEGKLEPWQLSSATLGLITLDHTIKVTNVSSVTIGDARLLTSADATVKISKVIKTPIALLANWGMPAVPTGSLNVRAAQALAAAAAQPQGQRIAVAARKSRRNRKNRKLSRKALRKMRY